MDTHEVERIRSLWETYMRGSQWLEKPEALQALGAEVGLLLRMIDAQQAVVDAAESLTLGADGSYAGKDGSYYRVSATALDRVIEGLLALKATGRIKGAGEPDKPSIVDTFDALRKLIGPYFDDDAIADARADGE